MIFDDYIKHKLNNKLKAIKDIGGIAELGKISVTIEFITYQVSEDNSVLVLTGTKDNPAGISNTNASHVLFINDTTGDIYFMEISKLKEFIKLNWSELKKELDSDEFKILGVRIPINKLGI